MASGNPFDILGDDDNDDPSLLIAAQQQKVAVKKPTVVAPAKEQAKFPSKPVPPAQAVREASSGGGSSRGGAGGGRGGQARGRGGRAGGNRDYASENASGFSGAGYGFGGGGGDDGETQKLSERERGTFGGPRGPYRGGRRGGYANGEVGGDQEQQGRRVYERRSGTGRGNELKREGSGRGNWGTMSDDVIAMGSRDVQSAEGKVAFSEKPQDEERPAAEVDNDRKEDEVKDREEKEEDKEMTLEEYEKIKEEKRKALLSTKMEERKVDVDQEFGSMKPLSSKKGSGDIFIQLGPTKDSRKSKDNTDKDDKAKKPVSINEFLKPAEGGRYGSSGRGRGRGRGGRGSYYANSDSGFGNAPEAHIKIEDPGQFPTLGGK